MKKAIIWLSVLGFVMLLATIGAYLIAFTMIVSYKNEPAVTAQPEKVILPPTSSEVEAAINQWRVENSLAAFNSEVPALDEAAQARAEGMCAENDWSHNRDWEVLNKYYVYQWAGENLYYGSLMENQSADAITTWANSPTHLENMQKAYTQIGIGVKLCPTYQGRSNVVIVTNYFGVPR